LKMGLANNVSPTVLQEKVEVPLEIPDDFFWPADEVFIPVSFPQANYAQLISYTICNVKGENCVNFLQGEQAYFCCEFQLKETIGVPIAAVMITNKFNVLIHSKSSCLQKVSVPKQVNHGDRVRFCHSITLSIAPGEYVLGFALVTMQADDYACIDELPQAEFNSRFQICDVYEKVGVFYVTSHYSNNHHSHFGLCNLPGKGQIQVLTSSK
ncbi:Wzt carbohydrate-binding domain-containing protein, partial [Nostoc sp.]